MADEKIGLEPGDAQLAYLAAITGVIEALVESRLVEPEMLAKSIEKYTDEANFGTMKPGTKRILDFFVTTARNATQRVSE